MTCNKVVALVLAAGYARRFGSDKRIAETNNGQQLLQRTLIKVKKNYASCIVVLREQDDLKELSIPSDIDVTFAPMANDGLGWSIAAGVNYIIKCGSSQQSVAIFLGDMPFIKSNTLRSLSDLADERRIVRPCFNGVSGHPVLFGRKFFEDLALLKGDTGANKVVVKNVNDLKILDVSDPGVVKDVDRPADI